MASIPFNKPYIAKTLTFKVLEEVLQSDHLMGDGDFTNRCHSWLHHQTGAAKSLLTHSCTGALELAALLLNVMPGDEIIMPSFTFVSTANAFVLRGGVPVFVDIRRDTLNLDESLIESAITKKTKAIVPVHYAGVSCEMDVIMDIANHHNINVIEDAAQGVMSEYLGKALGTIGHLGAYSFHGTKNIISGEGGALLINDIQYCERAEIVREKGTDRSKFIRSEVDRYTWQDVGSSFLPSELSAAFLWAQLNQAKEITLSRLKIWNFYHELLGPIEKKGYLRRPFIPKECSHNGHIYYVVLPNQIDCPKLISDMANFGVQVQSHYVPLHDSRGGRRYGKKNSDLLITENIAKQIIRLPIWVGLKQEQQEMIVHQLFDSILRQIK